MKNAMQQHLNHYICIRLHWLQIVPHMNERDVVKGVSEICFVSAYSIMGDACSEV